MNRLIVPMLAMLCIFSSCDDEDKLCVCPSPTADGFAMNNSTPTLCAEEDNINIALYGNVGSFTIESTHALYEIGTDNCDPDFTNCPPPQPGYAFDDTVESLYDDGTTVLEAVREEEWWKPNGMDVSVDQGTPMNDIHYIRMYRKTEEASEWPQFLVLYMDGNLRLIPHPPIGAGSVCFGSSVVIGPATISNRPIAEIASVEYRSSNDDIMITYTGGGTAGIDILELDRSIARIRVTVKYPTDTRSFATFRSMYIADGNADVDHVDWRSGTGVEYDLPIGDFEGGTGAWWLFRREMRSSHNTSAPDIRIRIEP